MTIRKILLSTMALAVLAGPAIVSAQAEDTPPPPAGGPGGHPGPMGGPMDSADVDNDGLLSKPEFMAVHEKRFDEMDANKDGKLSKDELKAHREAMKAKFDAKRKEWEAKKKAGGDVPPPAPAAPAAK